jgi:hypothetical protein
MLKIKIERYPTKLTQEAYDELCAILRVAPRLPFKAYQHRNPGSLSQLSKRFGIDLHTTHKIAKDVREGRADRLYGVRAMLHDGRHFVRGVGITDPTTGRMILSRNDKNPLWCWLEGATVSAMVSDKDPV